MDQSHAVFLSPTNLKPTPVQMESLRIKLVLKDQIIMFWFMDGELMKKERNIGLAETHGDRLGDQMEHSK